MSNSEDSVFATGRGQSIENLRLRYEKLNESRIKVQAQRDAARQQLEQLRQQAIDQFGSDDLAVLRSKLTRMKEDNEQKRAEYEKSLDAIETELDRINRETEVSSPEMESLE